MEILFQILKAVAASLVAVLLGGSASVIWGGPIALVMTLSIGLVALLAPSAASCTPRLSELSRRLGFGVAICVLLQSLAWASSFDSQQSSDFGVYYRCGVNLMPSLLDNLNTCQSAYISYGDVYWRRSLLSTVPIGWLGGGYLQLKIFNAFLQGLAALVIWSAAMRWVGPVAALIAVVVFAVYPDRSFALTLATSDHAATLLTSLGLACLAALNLGGRARVAAAFAVGVIIVALALTRSTGVVLLGAAALVIFLQTAPRNGLAVSVVCLTVLIAAVLGAQTVANAVLAAPGAADSFLRVASSLDINPEGSFSKSFVWSHHFWPAIPADQRTRMELIRVGHEVLSDGMFYPAYLLSKAKTLTSGLGYAWFAAADLALNKDTVRTVAAAHVPTRFSADPVIARFASIPMLGLVLAGTLRARRTEFCVAALGFFCVGVGGMLFLGEVQARYLLVVLPAMAFLAGAAFAPLASQSIGSRLRDFACGAGALSVLLAIGLSGWMAMRTLIVIPSLNPVQFGSSVCPTRADQVTVNGQQLALNLGAGETCAEATFVLTRGGESLSLFVSDGQFPYRFETPASNHILYRVTIDETSIERYSIPGKVIWEQLSLPRHEQIRVSVSARRPRELAENPVQEIFAYPVVWQSH